MAQNKREQRALAIAKLASISLQLRRMGLERSGAPIEIREIALSVQTVLDKAVVDAERVPDERVR